MNFFDLDQERTALAYALSSADNMHEAALCLPPALFDDFRHQKLWEAARGYYQAYGGVLDQSGLELVFRQNATPEGVQPVYFAILDDLRTRVVPQDRFKVAVETLRGWAIKRRLFELGNRVVGYLQRSDVPLDAVCNDIVNAALSVQDLGDSDIREMSFKEALTERIKGYIDRRDHPEKYRGIPYGIKPLDAMTGGMRSGELIIVYGRPSTFKSMWCHNVAYYAASLGYHVMLFTIEMPKEQQAMRLDSRHFHVSVQRLRFGTLAPEEEQLYVRAPQIALLGDISIQDMPQGCSMAQILPVIRKHRRRHPVDLVVIDYLNLMEPTRWSHSRVERVSDIGRELKVLARLEKVPVFTPARAIRDVVKGNEEKDIGTEHLSWSDALGYDADQLFYLKRPKPIDTLQSQSELVVVKSREGPTGRVLLGANADYSFVGDIEILVKDMANRSIVLAASDGCGKAATRTPAEAASAS